LSRRHRSRYRSAVPGARNRLPSRAEPANSGRAALTTGRRCASDRHYRRRLIGSAPVRRAGGDGHHVLNIDKLTYAGRLETVASVSSDPNYSFLCADGADTAAMIRALADFAPDVVFHLAAETHVDRSVDHPAAFIETNVSGTYTLLEAALRYWSALDGSRGGQGCARGSPATAA
jgi:hypothetical protein